MSLIHWKRPQNSDIRRTDKGFNSLQSEINQLFEDFLGDFNLQNISNHPTSAMPAVDIVESEKGYNVSAELPAMDTEDIDLSIDNNYLTIKGEKKEEKEERSDNDTIIRSERYYGSYQRTIALPENADSDKAKASFNKGVLSIEIPKKAEALTRARKIDIKASA